MLSAHLLLALADLVLGGLVAGESRAHLAERAAAGVVYPVCGRTQLYSLLQEAALVLRRRKLIPGTMMNINFVVILINNYSAFLPIKPL